MATPTLTQVSSHFFIANFAVLDNRYFPLLKNVPPGSIIVQRAILRTDLPDCPEQCDTVPDMFIMGCPACDDDWQHTPGQNTVLQKVTTSTAAFPVG